MRAIVSWVRHASPGGNCSRSQKDVTRDGLLVASRDGGERKVAEGGGCTAWSWEHLRTTLSSGSADHSPAAAGWATTAGAASVMIRDGC
jgi:hypothetical protein